ncbi:MAG: Smr/MutS family protein, partial [Gemmatimonadales bacterium]
VRVLRRVLEEADDGSLVLLDEVGSGTDPAEGAALAAATLVSLTGRGAVTLATTHLGALKDLASHTPGVVNASLQFDAATLTPTYRFLKGVPGRSYGLAIARRLGVAGEILTDAEARVPAAERNLDTLLAAVEERERGLRATQAELAERSVELDTQAARLGVQAESQSAREAELKRREKEAEHAGRRQARRYLMDARQRVEQALASASAAVDDAAAREARRIVEEGIRAEGERLAEAEHTEAARTAARGAEAIGVGARVRVPAGGSGRVLEARGDGKLVVAIGAVRMVLDPATVTLLPAAPPPASPAAGRLESSPADSALEIDLRGMTGDEAEMAAVAAVDAAVLAEQPFLRIIHGMGTGVVRERVRRVVANDRRIARYGFAPRSQGGTGVTVVEFSP